MADEHGASEEELLEQLEAELKKLKVSDVLVQTVFTVSSLGYRSLGEESRDLDQAQLAIDALRALVPVLKGAVADEVTATSSRWSRTCSSPTPRPPPGILVSLGCRSL